MQKILINIDTNAKSLINSVGQFLTRTADQLTLERNQWQILCIQFYDRAVDSTGAVVLNPYVIQEGTTFSLVGDNDFIDDNELMIKSLQNSTPFNETDPNSNCFNIQGDWIDDTTADYAKGQLSIRINTATQKFSGALGANLSKNQGLFLNLKQYAPGFTKPTSLVWIHFTAKNTLNEGGLGGEPVTQEELVKAANQYHSNPPERRWSKDGIIWVNTQLSETPFYQERISNVRADWSKTIQLYKGKVGDKGDNSIIFTPTLDKSQPTVNILSWSNDGNVPNPKSVDIKGDYIVFKPTLDGEGNLSWSNDKGLENPATVNVKGNPGIDAPNGYAYQAKIEEKDNQSILSWTNTGNGENPEPVNIRGDNGKIPYTKNGNWWVGDTDTGVIAGGGYFEAHLELVGDEYILSWSNNLGMENPAPTNIRGAQGEVGLPGETGIKGERGDAGSYYLPVISGDEIDFVLQ